MPTHFQDLSESNRYPPRACIDLKPSAGRFFIPQPLYPDWDPKTIWKSPTQSVYPFHVAPFPAKLCRFLPSLAFASSSTASLT